MSRGGGAKEGQDEDLDSNAKPPPLVIERKSLLVEDGGDLNPGYVLAWQVDDWDGVLESQNQRQGPVAYLAPG